MVSSMKGKDAAAAMAILRACSAPSFSASAVRATFIPPETMPPLRDDAPQPMRSASSTVT